MNSKGSHAEVSGYPLEYKQTEALRQTALKIKFNPFSIFTVYTTQAYFVTNIVL